jgi:hypothetical protein
MNSLSGTIVSPDDPRCVPLEADTTLGTIPDKYEVKVSHIREILIPAIQCFQIHPVKITIEFDSSKYTGKLLGALILKPKRFLRDLILVGFREVIIQSNLYSSEYLQREYRWEIRSSHLDEDIGAIFYEPISWYDIAEGIFRVKYTKDDHIREILSHIEFRKRNDTLYVFPIFRRQ